MQAASADVEKSRSLTWAEAMKAGDTPVPPAEDDVYADTGARADIHQLAAKVRTHRQALSELQRQWNDLVKVSVGVGLVTRLACVCGGGVRSGVALRICNDAVADH
jgi:hypothetical protein